MVTLLENAHSTSNENIFMVCSHGQLPDTETDKKWVAQNCVAVTIKFCANLCLCVCLSRSLCLSRYRAARTYHYNLKQTKIIINVKRPLHISRVDSLFQVQQVVARACCPLTSSPVSLVRRRDHRVGRGWALTARMSTRPSPSPSPSASAHLSTCPESRLPQLKRIFQNFLCEMFYGSFSLAETRVQTRTRIAVLYRNRERDPSPSLCNVNMFGIVQCSHRVWNPNPRPYPSPSPSM